MTLADLLAAVETMTLERRRHRYREHLDTEEAYWQAFKEALARLADGREDTAGLMGLLQHYGFEGVDAIYMGWRARRIEERKPPKPKRRRR